MEINAALFMQFILFAVLVEAVIEGVVWTIESVQVLRNGNKPNDPVYTEASGITLDISEDKKIGWNWKRAVAFGGGILFAIGFNIDLFVMAGFEGTIPYLGMIGSGIILARGANFVNDLIGKLGG